MKSSVENNVSDTLQANLMTTIVSYPERYSQVELAVIHRLNHGTVKRAFMMLDGVRHWVDKGIRREKRNGRNPYVFHPSEVFFQDRDHAIDAVATLPENDMRLFEDGIKNAEDERDLMPGSFEANIAHSNVLGRAALLGGRYDLSEMAPWLEGEAGWRLLIVSSIVDFQADDRHAQA